MNDTCRWKAVRPCSVCGEERARRYCAADEARLCERCNGSVCLDNVASRHGRVRVRFNGEPIKINHHSTKTDEARSRSRGDAVDRIVGVKGRYHGSRKQSRITYSRLTGHSEIQKSLLHVEATAKEAKCSVVIPNQEVSTISPQMGLKNDSQLPPSEISICNINVDQTEHRTSNDFLEYLSTTCQAEDSDFAQEVPNFEAFPPELISAGHGDLMEHLLPTSPPSSNDAPFYANQEIKTDHQVDHFFDSESRLCEIEVDMSSMIEEGSISIDDASGVDAFGMLDICVSSNLNKTDELDHPIMDMWRSHMDCSGRNRKGSYVLGLSPFKTRGERQLEPQNVKLEEDTYPIPFSYGNPVEKMETSMKSRKILYKALSLRLNYEDVLSAWSDRGPLWMDGYRPQLVPDDSILDESCWEAGVAMDLSSPSYVEVGQQAGQELHEVPAIDPSIAEREARVLRYREKRRTRLFCKKIRYEVRKLNAEKRPRMKGRFVKRSSAGTLMHEFKQ
eukprot:c29150_g1_i1 orf=576-2087(-)